MTGRPLTLFVLFLSLHLSSFSQTCNCETNFNWVRKTFEENDAGFRYALEIKGQQAYDYHNQVILAKVRAAKTLSECTPILYSWLTFFRPGHIGIRLNSNTASTAPDTLTADQFKDWPSRTVDLRKFEEYLHKKTIPDWEGIWQLNAYTIAIQKDGNNYIGTIDQSGVNTWKKGMIKLRITRDSASTTGTVYLLDHSAETSPSVSMIGYNHLQIGRFRLERKNPALKDDPAILDYFKMLASGQPYFQQLNATTLYCRIPSFLQEQKAGIDSVLAANKQKILSTPNLIIDIRSGTGGSDDSYMEILPYLYTDPIRTVGVELLSTKLNNQRMLDIINKPEYGANEGGKRWARRAYDKLETQLGKFVNLDSVPVSIDKYDTVYPYPQKVGIIANEENGSTDEQFLLAAKQSKKVKIFGATTFGELDISNMYFVESPCKEFTLGYCLSRSMRIPGMTIDGKGIQPDYYLDKTIPAYSWVQFVNTVLNQK